MTSVYYGVYKLALWLIFPLLLLVMAIHSVIRRGGFSAYLYKLTILRPRFEGQLNRIWIHGVSAGEIASAKCVSRLLEKDYKLFISSNTFSGKKMSDMLFPQSERGFYPFDYPLFCGRMLIRVKPLALVFVEGEIWPNMLRKA
ncbi:MAG: hypothetical protein OEZ36_09110, partial [Spirochaetota bacterium]|nr:hypothetical protein [Spirochaetota bacterium]